jgi:general secretion pathway protein J
MTRPSSIHPFSRGKGNGFTLIEVIIAMSIFAILAILSYSGLHSVIMSKTNTEASLERLQELQMTMLTLSSDLQQISSRDAHDALGGSLHKLSTQSSEYLIEFTRSGWRNPANLPRSSLQRVAYQLKDDALIRIYWPHIDRADDEQRVERTLIHNIESLDIQFLNADNEWKEDWPSASALTSSAPTALPTAIDVRLKMNDWGEIRRLIKVSI